MQQQIGWGYHVGPDPGAVVSHVFEALRGPAQQGAILRDCCRVLSAGFWRRRRRCRRQDECSPDSRRSRQRPPLWGGLRLACICTSNIPGYFATCNARSSFKVAVPAGAAHSPATMTREFDLEDKGLRGWGAHCSRAAGSCSTGSRNHLWGHTSRPAVHWCWQSQASRRIYPPMTFHPAVQQCILPGCL